MKFDGIGFDVAAMQKRKGAIVKGMTQGILSLLKAAGATPLQGQGKLLTGRKVEFTGGDGSKRTLQAKHVVIASGSEPMALRGVEFERPLQFEVAAYRLRDEYGVEAAFESVTIVAARWVRCDDAAHLDEFVKKLPANVARDHAGQLVYLAPSTVSLALTQERWPKIQFFTTRESSVAAG